jgi:hypothetical protein
MTKARDLANLISGGFTEADIPNLSASKITSGTFADARIAASNVSQHATSFDDNKIVNDISTLAIRQASNENKAAYNTNSMYVDVFQDSTGITNLTNVSNVAEYLASVYSVKNQFIPSLHRTSDHTGQLGTASWTGGGSTANGWQNAGGSQYTGTLVNELWDLSNDFLCRVFFGANGGSGSLQTTQYPACSVLITTDTSIAAGSDPDIFASSTAHTAYGNNYANWSDGKFLTSAAQTAFGTSGISYSNFETNSGTGAQSHNANNGNFNSYGYYNDTNAWAGFQILYDKSASTITYQPISWNGSSVGLITNNGVATISNVPSTGRAVIAYGEAYNTSIAFQTSYVNGNVSNDDFSYKYSGSVNATGSFESNAITASSSVSKMGAIITYQDNAGTNALNTDIVMKLSADNGSNYTTATLTALPDFATGIKMAKINDLSVTAGTQLKYKMEFANQASGSKEARIRGVSLQY